jgi:hypothetical protein
VKGNLIAEDAVPEPPLVVPPVALRIVPKDDVPPVPPLTVPPEPTVIIGKT